ncbi:MAG: hypothetical protein LBT42_08150 [Tannerella sp.]|jgi:hypothetical protein|nr:hypothetical protein [Tannerella sp.]
MTKIYSLWQSLHALAGACRIAFLAVSMSGAVASGTHAQDGFTVHGTVTDVTGETLAGVNIVQKGGGILSPVTRQVP